MLKDKFERFADWIEEIIGAKIKPALEDKILIILLFNTAFVGFLLLIGDLIQGLGPSYYLFSFFASVLLAGLFIYARKKTKIRYFIIPYSIILLIVFIYLWYNSGGIQGSSLFFLMPVIFIIPLFVKGINRLFVYLIILGIGIALFILEIYNTGILRVIENEQSKKIDMFVSSTLIATTILFVFILIIRSYDKQHKQIIALNNSKDKLLSLIAHDLKNPIGALNGLGQMLLYKHDQMNSDDRSILIRNIVKSSGETYNLLENLLQWARSESGLLILDKTRINLNKIIDDTISLFEESLKNKAISLEKNIDKECHVFADQNMLMAVFRNLLSNAVKFTPEKGKIFITVKENRKYNKVEITFKDTGIGMNQEQLEKIFSKETIYTSPGTDGEKGTGFGLKISKEFIERNGGALQIKSDLDMGSEFLVTFISA